MRGALLALAAVVLVLIVGQRRRAEIKGSSATAHGRGDESTGTQVHTKDPKQPRMVWYVPSLRYTRGLGWRMHCGAEVTESSTNKQHHLSHQGWQQQQAHGVARNCVTQLRATTYATAATTSNCKGDSVHVHVRLSACTHTARMLARRLHTLAHARNSPKPNLSLPEERDTAALNLPRGVEGGPNLRVLAPLKLELWDPGVCGVVAGGDTCDPLPGVGGALGRTAAWWRPRVPGGLPGFECSLSSTCSAGAARAACRPKPSRCGTCAL